MSCRRSIGALIATLLLTSSPAAAQGGLSQVVITVLAPDGQVATGARVELTAVSRLALGRVGTVQRGAIAWSLPPATWRVRTSMAGFRDTERQVDIAAGDTVSIEIRLTASTANEPPEAGDALSSADLAYHARFGAALLDELPSARTANALLETAHGFLIADRIDGGGLFTGELARLGGQGSSATQTTWRLDGIDVTDPLDTGVPLVYPDLGAFDAVTVESADMDPSSAGPGPVLTLALRRPGDRWTGSAQLSAAPAGLIGEARAIAPIARLESWTDGSVAAGGPLGDRFGLFATGRVTDSRRVEREVPASLDGQARSFTAHLVGHPRPDGELRATATYAALERPAATRARFADRRRAERHHQVTTAVTWEQARESAAWTVSAAYQGASTDATGAASGGGLIERLLDGPPLQLVQAPNQARRRWDVRASVEPFTRRWFGRDHIIRAGASAGGAGATLEPGDEPPFGELVNGQPARVWDVRFRGPESRWRTTTASAFVSDRWLAGDRLTIAGAVRLEMDRGSAAGAADDISWFNASPRVSLRWQADERGRFAITTGYGWYRQRLPLGYFAVGDPAGPSGTMSRWDDADGDGRFTPSELTPIAEVGSCCAGSFPAQIADGLRRPTTRAFHVGFEHRFGAWRWGIMGLDRREDDVVALVNVGLTPDDYAVTFVEDPGVDIAGLQGFNILPIYNRRPGTFGRDRYVLDNADGTPSRYQGVEITVARDAGERWHFRFGGSAYRSEGVGASRGYRPDENDQGLLGEAFLTPNAATSARGRLFYDRAYVMKVLGGYTSPGPFRAAFVARYQDGQPFSRVLVAQGLHQGADLVQTYPRGGQRFTYTLTLDARAELRWPIGGGRTVGVTLDAFNLLDLAHEVEEDIVTGPAFRAVTAVQPPRVVRIGARVTF